MVKGWAFAILWVDTVPDVSKPVEVKGSHKRTAELRN
jgi:hypothetical protein